MGSPRFPLLTPHNYVTWTIRAWSKMVAPFDPHKLNEYNHNNKVTIGSLRNYAHEDLIFHIDNCKIVKEAWDKFARVLNLMKISCH